LSRIDVVIPCYNYGRYLRGCVESVLSQPGVQVRVLILDDCSPDNTPEIGAALAAEDSRVEYRRHAVNQRHIATYNEGLAWATGDYTLLLSADDLVTPGALGRAARVLDAHPEVSFVYGRQLLFSTEAPDNGPVRQDDTYRIVTGPIFIASLCASGSNPVNTPTAIVRTALLGDVGSYRADLPHTADLELWLRFATYGSVGILEAEQAHKRMHGQNMQLAYTDGQLRDLQGRMAGFDRFFEKCGFRIPAASRLHETVRRAIASETFWAASNSFDRRDSTNCRSLLNYALELCPELASSPEYARFRWKQRLGTRLWSWVRPVASLVRGREASPAHDAQSSSANRPLLPEISS
jgi:glycosyltransferase involved in cell wall biosynthesis